MPPSAYSAAVAKKIVDISQRCLDYWDERGIVKPSILEASGKGSERAYSFDDLLKLTLVKKLRESGLSLQRIQKGLAVLRKRWPKDDALLNEVIVTDGVTLFRRIKRDQLEDLLADGQLVFSVVAVGVLREALSDKIVRIRKGNIPTRGRRNTASA